MLLRSLTKAINQLTRTFHNKKLFKCLKPRKSERCGKFDFFLFSLSSFPFLGKYVMLRGIARNCRRICFGGAEK